MGEVVVGFQIPVVPLEVDPEEELDVPVPELVAPELLDVEVVAPPVPDPEEDDDDDDACAPVPPAPPEPAPDDPHAAPREAIAPATRRRVTNEARAGEGHGFMALLSRRSPARVHAERGRPRPSHPHGHFPPGVISTSTLSAPAFASMVRIEAHGAEVIQPFVTVAV